MMGAARGARLFLATPCTGTEKTRTFNLILEGRMEILEGRMKVQSTARLLIKGVAFLLMVGVGAGLTALRAQETSFGTILGTITDTSQAAIPGVSVTVTNVNTGIARHVDTDAVGAYRVGSLQPGTYTVRAEHAGFQVTQATDAIVHVAAILTVNIVMQVGTVTQTVVVTAAAPLLQTASATIGAVVNNASVLTIPLDGRNFTDLIGLIPGAVSTGVENDMFAGANYSVSGNRSEQNNFTLDGIYDNDECFKGYGLRPSIDAIQEFKVQTNITSAEYGQAAGSNVNVAIKAGTNQIHGTGFNFYRGNALTANAWFNDASNIPESKYVRNQFGGTLGGPLVIPNVYNGKDKSFWFGSYEGFRSTQGSTVVGYLPTAAQFGVGGGPADLRDQPPIYDPSTAAEVSPGVITRQQINCNGVLNEICRSQWDPWVTAYTNIFYTPYLQSAPAGTSYNTFVNTSPTTTSWWTTSDRFDQKLRDNLNFFGRFSLWDGTQLSATSMPHISTNVINNFRNAVASWTMVANPTTVIDWKVGYNRLSLLTPNTAPAGPSWPAFLAAHPANGVSLKYANYPEYPALGMPSSSYSTPSQTGDVFAENEYQADGSLSKIKGKHTIKTGMEFLDVRSLDDGNFTSTFQFYSLQTADPQNISNTGSVLASYLLGNPGGGVEGLGSTAYYGRQERWQGYLQDDIKLTRKLTVNLGIRYEYNQWTKERWNRVGAFDPTTPPYGAYLWAGYNPVFNEPANVRRSYRDPQWNAFAPRLGLAYQVTPKTTFRAGFGVFRVANDMWEAQGVRGQWPYALSGTLSGYNPPTALPSEIAPLETAYSPATVPGPGAPETGAYTFARTDRGSYAMQWNGGFQEMLTSSLMLEVDYVGNGQRKGAIYANINTCTPMAGTCGTAADPRPYGNQWGTMSNEADAVSNEYNSLQVKVEKRFSNGLQFLSSYAWAHEIDIGGSSWAQSWEFAPQNPSNWAADRADGTFDYRHIWTFSEFYQLPFGQNKKYLSSAKGVLNQVVGGWQLSQCQPLPNRRSIKHYNPE